MMAFIGPRLRKPLAIALAGTVFAAAWALRGGHAWQLSVVIEVTVLVGAITWYVRAGEEAIGDGELRQGHAHRRGQHKHDRAARPSKVAGRGVAIQIRCQRHVCRTVL